MAPTAGPHGIPHTFLGGHMISYESVNDPAFLGHHSMMDKYRGDALPTLIENLLMIDYLTL